MADIKARRIISIHAPSRERLPILRIPPAMPVFQSTLPHGSDSIIGIYITGIFNFNPRSLTGATEPFRAYNLIYNISIHAPSRERHTANIKSDTRLKFQSTLPHGSDVLLMMTVFLVIKFQSTLPHGSDLLQLLLLLISLEFQSTLPHGSDP